MKMTTIGLVIVVIGLALQVQWLSRDVAELRARPHLVLGSTTDQPLRQTGYCLLTAPPRCFP